MEAMCWMPDSGMIIFASASYLYTILVLSFEEDFVDTESSGAAIPVYDLRETQIPQEQTGDLLTYVDILFLYWYHHCFQPFN